MKPSRFEDIERYEFLRGEINKKLCFIGLFLNDSGVFNPVEKAQNISQAKLRVNRFRSILEARNAHKAIFNYCNSELISENYFHSVFEAVKSIAEEVRKISELTSDGGELIDRAFLGSSPILKINAYQTETEISEQKGFANLIKGIFGMFRNTTAHSPKIIWSISEEDALDIMSTISLIHRRLETASRL